MTSRISKLLPMKPTTMNPTLTLISLKVLVNSMVLMLRRGEAERHRQVGATAVTELRRRSGDVGLMARGRCATLVVYVCIYLIYPIWRLLTVSRLCKVDPEDEWEECAYWWAPDE